MFIRLSLEAQEKINRVDKAFQLTLIFALLYPFAVWLRFSGAVAWLFALQVKLKVTPAISLFHYLWILSYILDVFYIQKMHQFPCNHSWNCKSIIYARCFLLLLCFCIQLFQFFGGIYVSILGDRSLKHDDVLGLTFLMYISGFFTYSMCRNVDPIVSLQS